MIQSCRTHYATPYDYAYNPHDPDIERALASLTWSTRKHALSAPTAFLFLDGPFGGRYGLQPSVWDWLATFDRESVCPSREPRLGPLESN